MKDKYQYTPLHWAAEKNSTEVALQLIQAKADVDVKDKYQKTPLDVAASKNVSEMILELAQEGADIESLPAKAKSMISTMLSNKSALQSAQGRDSIHSCEVALHQSQNMPSLRVQVKGTERKLQLLQRARESVLSESPPWLAEPGPPQLSVPPAHWAVQVGQLKKFLHHVRQTDVYKQLVLERGAVNIYAINDFMIIPRSSHGQQGLAAVWLYISTTKGCQQR